MQKPTENQERTLNEMFSAHDREVLKRHLSQDAFRHFEDALHGKAVATVSGIAEWKSICDNAK
jgi:hypothetical protein